MLIRYKIGNQHVEPHVFKQQTNDTELSIWENVINTYKEELQKSCASVIIQLSDGRLAVVTETKLLFKLYNAVQSQISKENFAVPEHG